MTQVTLSLQDMRPYHLNGISVLSLSFIATESRSSNLCITAPSGYVHLGDMDRDRKLVALQGLVLP